MKKTLLAIIVLAGCLSAMGGEELYTLQVFTNKPLNKLTTNYSPGVELSGYKPRGEFAVFFDASGLSNATATADLALEFSPNGSWWLATNLVTGLTNTGGRASNGKEYYELPSIRAPYIRLRTIIGAGTGGVINAWLIVR